MHAFWVGSLSRDRELSTSRVEYLAWRKKSMQSRGIVNRSQESDISAASILACATIPRRNRTSRYPKVIDCVLTSRTNGRFLSSTPNLHARATRLGTSVWSPIHRRTLPSCNSIPSASRPAGEMALNSQQRPCAQPYEYAFHCVP